MDTLQDHPIASIFPLLAEPELAELAESIKWDGVQVPIVLYEGKILDGRNRYRAAQRVGAHVPHNYYTGESPTAHVIALNLKRRHLTASQRAMVGRDALPFFEAEAKARMSSGGKGETKLSHLEKGRAAVKAAEATGSSQTYIKDAKRIEKVSPETAAEVRAGKKSISKAKEELFGKVNRLDPAQARPIPELQLSPEQTRDIEQAEKDKPALWALKFHWRAAGKKDRLSAIKFFASKSTPKDRAAYRACMKESK